QGVAALIFRDRLQFCRRALTEDRGLLLEIVDGAAHLLFEQRVGLRRGVAGVALGPVAYLQQVLHQARAGVQVVEAAWIVFIHALGQRLQGGERVEGALGARLHVGVGGVGLVIGLAQAIERGAVVADQRRLPGFQSGGL